MNCAMSTIKVFVYIFNVIFGIIGLAFMSIASYLASSGRGDQQPFNIAGIAIGIAIFVISIIGCCALHRQSVCTVWMYAIIVGVFFLIQVALLVLFYTQDFDKITTNIIEEAWKSRHSNPSSMNYFQSKLKCCGFYNYTDYNKLNETIPSSCYEFNHVNEPRFFFKVGCLERMRYFVGIALSLIATISWIVLVIEGAAVVFSAVLANYYRRHRMSIYMY